MLQGNGEHCLVAVPTIKRTGMSFSFLCCFHHVRCWGRKCTSTTTQQQQPSGEPDGHSRNATRRKTRKNKGQLSRFKGHTGDLKQHVHDIGASQIGVDIFPKPTQQIPEHVSQNYKGGGEILTALDLDSLTFIALTNPPMTLPAADASIAVMEVWKLMLE